MSVADSAFTCIKHFIKNLAQVLDGTQLLRLITIASSPPGGRPADQRLAVGRVATMQNVTLVSRTNSELSAEDRKLVKRSTADFIKEHVTQPSGLDSPIFRDEEGFVTEEQSQALDNR